MAPDRRLQMQRSAITRVNEMLVKEYPELEVADHAFVCMHVATMLHQLFHNQATVDHVMKGVV